MDIVIGADSALKGQNQSAKGVAFCADEPREGVLAEINLLSVAGKIICTPNQTATFNQPKRCVHRVAPEGEGFRVRSRD